MCSANGYQFKFVYGLLVLAVIAPAAQIQRSQKCILPPYPKNGYYVVAGEPSAEPGDDPDSAFLNVTCNEGHGVVGNNVLSCTEGVWSTTMPRCEPTCYLPKQSSVEYHCLNPASEDHRECNEYEPPGTVIRPSCRQHYYHSGSLTLMRCLEGYWNYVAICLRECGTIPEDGTGLPWYVSIKKKNQEDADYKAICGGSIISNNLILTAAHCFKPTSYSKVKPSHYTVVVGTTNQSLDITDIKIPLRFRGEFLNFQSDIALVTLKTPLEYSAQVQPVCLDFDSSFESRQLLQGSAGKMPVWLGPEDNGSLLQVLEIPYISTEQCQAKAPPHFKEYITQDKFCAGHENGTVMCRGNSGGGISFPEEHRGVVRHYLRGIVSTSPSQDEDCAATDIVAFTQVNKHENFIREYFV